jgi:hypothetical protein
MDVAGKKRALNAGHACDRYEHPRLILAGIGYGYTSRQARARLTVCDQIASV